MRGVVRFHGTAFAGAALLNGLGCTVLSAEEEPDLATLHVYAPVGGAADMLAMAECEGALEFSLDEESAQSGTFAPIRDAFVKSQK